MRESHSIEQPFEKLEELGTRKRKMVKTELTGEQSNSTPRIHFLSPLYVSCKGNRPLCYRNARNRKLLDPILYDLENLSNETPKHLIKSQGWESFLCSEEPIYPELVHEFYETLIISEGGHVCSSVKGVFVEFDGRKVNEILGIPNQGKRLNRIDEYSHDGFEKDSFIRSIVNKELPQRLPKFIPKSSLLKRFRILHDLISSCILPSSGHHSRLSYHDIFFMWCMITHTQINFGHSFIQRITSPSNNASLPFGMILTKIFKACEVDLTNEEHTSVTTKFTTMDSTEIDPRDKDTEEFDGIPVIALDGESDKENSNSSVPYVYVPVEKDLSEDKMSHSTSINTRYLVKKNRDKGKMDPKPFSNRAIPSACLPVPPQRNMRSSNQGSNSNKSVDSKLDTLILLLQEQKENMQEQRKELKKIKVRIDNLTKSNVL